MEATIIVTFFLYFSSAYVLADQLVVLNLTQYEQVKVINSSVAKHEDVTICARFLVEPSAQSEIFTYGPLTLKRRFDPNQAFDQLSGEVHYWIPTSWNSPSKTFAIWPPGVWNHVCVSFTEKDCSVRVILNGQTVVESKMDPCYGFSQLGFLGLGSNMVGLLTDINIWKQVISREEAKAWTQCETEKEGNLVAWKGWTKSNYDIPANKVFLDKNDICRKPGQILGYEQIMHFETILNFCWLLGGRMPTIGDNKTMERMNETLMAIDVPKWAFTGYILDEKKDPVNTYTG